ncbi:regulatory protein GemA [Azospirillum agricola]|uniref:regulatory protein GemA n=1 Tax=Azospirillum agricola TaxID=1720247 RepID=UPI000A0EF482|nr:regulatory protein GemA [Azospirillum agricola]SMH32078.1 Protein of unknown function [Azospirillum lipoferum]
MPLSRNKIAVIQVARQQLGLTEEDYRSLLRNYGGVASSKDLSDDGFEAVMFRLSQLGFRSTWNRANLGYRADMATPRQVAYIRRLWKDYTNGTGDDASLGKWLESKFKVSSVRFIPAANAQKIITALKSMQDRKPAGVAA